jgi:hypothetical protein
LERGGGWEDGGMLIRFMSDVIGWEMKTDREEEMNAKSHEGLKKKVNFCCSAGIN